MSAGAGGFAGLRRRARTILAVQFAPLLAPAALIVWVLLSSRLPDTSLAPPAWLQSNVWTIFLVGILLHALALVALPWWWFRCDACGYRWPPIKLWALAFPWPGPVVVACPCCGADDTGERTRPLSPASWFGARAELVERAMRLRRGARMALAAVIVCAVIAEAGYVPAPRAHVALLIALLAYLWFELQRFRTVRCSDCRKPLAAFASPAIAFCPYCRADLDQPAP